MLIKYRLIVVALVSAFLTACGGGGGGVGPFLDDGLIVRRFFKCTSDH